MAAEQNSKTNAAYLSEEVLELEDLISQLETIGVSSASSARVGATLLLVKQIRFLRDDLNEKS